MIWGIIKPGKYGFMNFQSRDWDLQDCELFSLCPLYMQQFGASVFEWFLCVIGKEESKHLLPAISLHILYSLLYF